MYSESTGNKFSFVSKLFNNNSSMSFVKNKFSNWKINEEQISGHENISDHQLCTMKWLLRLNKKNKY